MSRRLTAVLAVTAFLTIPAAGGAGAAEKTLRVALVLPPGANTSFVFRDQIDGLRRAGREFKVEGLVVTLSPKENWFAHLSSLAAQRYDLIFGPDFETVDAAAVRFPDRKFAVLGALEDLPHRPKNVAGTVFRYEEAGYLAGYLAALVTKRPPGNNVISSVGGIRMDVVDAYIAGYQAGARRADARIRTLNGYSGSFGDAAKCRAVALGQIAKGAGVLFQVAGACGLGALEAARSNGIWGIGVDVDQSSLGAHILTSAVVRRGVAVFDIIRALARGRFPGGRNLALRRPERGSRPRQDQSEGASFARGEGRAHPAADRRGSDPGHPD